jgi:MOSC domain-containing protein YiiM
MLLESVQVGLPQNRPSQDGARTWTTAYGKQPVRGPVQVRRTNLDGDAQVDRRWHGGPDMAVLAYPAAHYPRWAEELRWPDIAAGAFGENLTVSGTTELDACLGDVWRAGGATLQISQPRKPCRNISRFWNRPELLQLVVRTGRSGFYLRVLEEGAVEAGQEVRLLDRPYPDWTVARATEARARTAARPAEAEALLSIATLGADWREHIQGKLDRRQENPGADTSGA